MKQHLLKYPQDTECTVICRTFAHQMGIPKRLTFWDNTLEIILKDHAQYTLLINYNSLCNLQTKDESKMKRVFLIFLLYFYINTLLML